MSRLIIAFELGSTNLITNNSVQNVDLDLIIIGRNGGLTSRTYIIRRFSLSQKCITISSLINHTK